MSELKFQFQSAPHPYRYNQEWHEYARVSFRELDNPQILVALDFVPMFTIIRKTQGVMIVNNSPISLDFSLLPQTLPQCFGRKN